VSKLYVIIDAAVLASQSYSVALCAESLRKAEVTLLQYRDKDAGPQTVLRNAAMIGAAFSGSGATLILNDRADLAVLAGWDGVHVGQGDLSPEDAKEVLAGAGMPSHREGQERDGWGTRVLAGSKNPRLRSETWGTRGMGDSEWIVGVSTHTEAQVVAADAGVADYVAIGPVFATGTKLDAEAVVGLESVRRARALTRKPLVAIGGITRENARSVIEAGADSVAVISGLFVVGESVEKVARDFLEILG
jgi:thiamine-phosphate pyrophosphorylase